MNGKAKKDINFLQEKLALKTTCEDYDKIADKICGDTKFFEKCGIIDYSLLVGIHDKQLEICKKKFLKGKNR